MQVRAVAGQSNTRVVKVKSDDIGLSNWILQNPDRTLDWNPEERRRSSRAISLRAKRRTALLGAKSEILRFRCGELAVIADGTEREACSFLIGSSKGVHTMKRVRATIAILLLSSGLALAQ